MGIPRYIAIEGPIGVGKTSLARMLADRFNARMVLENPVENPFLERFYEDRAGNAFKTQVFFLLSRFQQQVELAQQNLFEQAIVSDYLFAKDRIFAYINLSDDELVLYERIFSMLQGRLVKPDVVIFLQARLDVLLERIKKRGIKYEANIDAEYLENVVNTYNKTFFHYNDTPLLVVNTSDIDFVSREGDFDSLVQEISTARKGVWHYIPLGSQ